MGRATAGVKGITLKRATSCSPWTWSPDGAATADLFHITERFGKRTALSRVQAPGTCAARAYGDEDDGERGKLAGCGSSVRTPRARHRLQRRDDDPDRCRLGLAPGPRRAGREGDEPACRRRGERARQGHLLPRADAEGATDELSLDEIVGEAGASPDGLSSNGAGEAWIALRRRGRVHGPRPRRELHGVRRPADPLRGAR